VENGKERDEWIAAIEFLRTRAIYESFTSQHTQVNFPLKEEEQNENEDFEEQNKKNLLYDFGKILK
jgi:hypothetical protein